MKLKFKLKSNRRGARLLGVCALDSAGGHDCTAVGLGPKSASAPTNF